jgi:hypothetical protein
MGSLGQGFVKSLLNVQTEAINRSQESFQIKTILSGVNQQLTYGVSSLNEDDNSYIRTQDGTVIFMIGIDTIGNNSVVKN